MGHSGTLDPLASGLLIILINRATKLFDHFSHMDKEYTAVLKLGIITDTWDAEGDVIEQTDDFNVSRKSLEAILTGLKGDFYQVPPVFSAKKIKGKPSYYYARNKIIKLEDIILNPTRVKIFDINLENFKEDMATINLTCSSGTYVRSIVHEIGKKLGCGATLTGLVRTRIGKFTLKDSIYFEELVKMQNAENKKLKKPEVYKTGIISYDDIFLQ